MDRPIPAFYCCYLLRSSFHHASLYVGSTPSPPRRLKQHNGLSKGGAKSTSRDALRPWEMVCLVTGFPSKISALQFEWAWQHSYYTRHIPISERTSTYRTVTRTSPRSGRKRTKIVAPRISLTDKLTSLHTLLRVRSFARWPLNVKFLADDVFRKWRKLGEGRTPELRDGICAELDRPPPVSERTVDPTTTEPAIQPEIAAIDVTYSSCKPHLEKSQSLLNSERDFACSVCGSEINAANTLAVVCPCGSCEAVTHLSCLSKHFLSEERDSEALVPTVGSCPECHTRLRWQDLVKDLSLRVRGKKESELLMKKRRQKLDKSAKPPKDPSKQSKRAGSGKAAESVPSVVSRIADIDLSSAIGVPVDVPLEELDFDEDDWIFQHLKEDEMDDDLVDIEGEEWDDIDLILDGTPPKSKASRTTKS